MHQPDTGSKESILYTSGSDTLDQQVKGGESFALLSMLSKYEGTLDRLTPGNKWSLTPMRKSPSLDHTGLNHNPDHTCVHSRVDRGGWLRLGSCATPVQYLCRVLWQPLVDIMSNYSFFSSELKNTREGKRFFCLLVIASLLLIYMYTYV